MAALSALVTCRGGLALQTLAVSPRCRRDPAISVSSASHGHRQSLVGLTMHPSGMMSPAKRTTSRRIRGVDPGTANTLGGNLLIPIPDILAWPLMIGAAIAAAVPLYRRFRTLEDKVEKTAETAIQVIDEVAEATEKIADEVAEAFSGNETLKKAAAKIKTIADEIEEDADKAEALVKKVDEIKKEVDSIVDPIIEKVAKDKS